ncbi:MAG: SDR family oxidoreductase, partial [Planctomycetota bacterium]
MPVALVTGASAGLGRAIVAALLASGYRIIMVSRSESGLEAAALELQAAAQDPHAAQGLQTPPDRLAKFAADVCQADDVLRLKEWMDSHDLPLNALINCVGQSDRGRAVDLTKTK